jgi:hypothetical protein
VKLGSETFADQDADDAAETVAEDGPILYADTAGGDRDIYVQHLGDDPEEGWIAFAARPPGSTPPVRRARSATDASSRPTARACRPIPSRSTPTASSTSTSTPPTGPRRPHAERRPWVRLAGAAASPAFS